MSSAMKPVTGRLQAAERRSLVLDAATTLFAERGFHAVSIDDIGGAVGISGPGLYRHFPSKAAMLAELLRQISLHLLSTGREVSAAHPDPAAALDSLVCGHIDFALDNPSLITIHDRELRSLPDEDRREVRRLQREYVEIWVARLVELSPALPEATARAGVQAVFGLLNSTPHSAGQLPREPMADVLRRTAMAALLGLTNP